MTWLDTYTVYYFETPSYSILYTVQYIMQCIFVCSSLASEVLAHSHTTETTACGSGPVYLNTAAHCVCVISNAVDSLKDCLCLIVTQSFFLCMSPEHKSSDTLSRYITHKVAWKPYVDNLIEWIISYLSSRNIECFCQIW